MKQQRLGRGGTVKDGMGRRRNLAAREDHSSAHDFARNHHLSNVSSRAYRADKAPRILLLKVRNHLSHSITDRAARLAKLQTI